MNRKKLYESIMKDVSKIIKKKLSESLYDMEDNIVKKIDTLGYGEITIKYAFDADTEHGDFYEVYDEDGEFLCELPYDIDLDNDEEIEDYIDEQLEIPNEPF